MKDSFCLAAALMELQETPCSVCLRKPQELLLNKQGWQGNAAEGRRLRPQNCPLKPGLLGEIAKVKRLVKWSGIKENSAPWSLKLDEN